MDLLTLISIGLIIIIGLPHGALDGSVFISLNLDKNIWNILLFVTLYILLASLVAFSWFYFPQVSLIFFLLISIFHFGIGDFQWTTGLDKYLYGFLNGGIIILGISYFNFDTVNNVYKYLSINTDLVWKFHNFANIVFLILLPFFITNIDKLRTVDFFRIFLSILLIILLPPIVAFAIYFCFIHTYNHFRRIVPVLKKQMNSKKIIYTFSIFTIFSWLIGFIVYKYFISSFGAEELIYRILFIGLAALTVPHMILIDFYFRPKNRI